MKKILEKGLGHHASAYSLVTIINDNLIQTNLGNLSYIEQMPIDENSLFDIASLSKTFTAVCIFLTVDKGHITFDTRVEEIDDKYINIGDLTIRDLLAHRQECWTPGHIKDAKTKEEIHKLLYESYVYSKIPQYSDVHYMILGRLLEMIYKKPLRCVVYDLIKIPFGLDSLTYRPEGTNVVDTRFERSANGLENPDTRLNLPHDPKSRLAAELAFDLGHAGVFISSLNLAKFLKLLVDGNLIKGKLYNQLLDHDDINSFNRKRLDENPSLNLRSLSKPYTLMGARLRNDLEIENEIPQGASDKAVYFSGYTGPAYLIDFESKEVYVLCCNVTHKNTMERLERKRYTTDLIWQVYRAIKEDL